MRDGNYGFPQLVVVDGLVKWRILQPITPNMDLVLNLAAAGKKISDKTSVFGNNDDLAVLAQTALSNRFVSWVNKGSCEAGRSSIKHKRLGGGTVKKAPVQKTLPAANWSKATSDSFFTYCQFIVMFLLVQ